ncbi:thyroglobulin-like [Paramacrobiotus metropolitanus]|uniref:thyroglobulin-like n=1 Tax=Paramacrobiotus metropolitanus TaxID=2943436 RepID=UPI0024462661|nr:thyroglobulin-like [Paramacrobiotus metropolitanus]
MKTVLFSVTFAVNLLQLVQCAPALSDCQAQKKDMRTKAVACWKVPSQRESVFYIPECDDETGAYKPEQCINLGASMECWCVTADGQELPGTRVTGVTNGRCTSGLASSLKLDEKVLETRMVNFLVTRINQCVKTRTG